MISQITPDFIPIIYAYINLKYNMYDMIVLHNFA